LCAFSQAKSFFDHQQMPCRPHRKPHCCLRVLLCLLALCYCAALLADAALDAYHRGSKAFKAGHYEAALQAFLEARRQGISQNSLDYNLGVTYYKLARFPEARRAFLAAARTSKMAPLAHYNLGLVALKQQQRNAARRWFQRTLAESDNPRLRHLADAMLTRSESHDNKLRQLPPWWGFITTGGGYDSNVTLQSDSETLVTSDQNDYFLNLFGYGAKRVAGTRDHGFSVDGSLYFLDYADLNAFDTTSFRAGGSLNHRRGRWRLNSGLHYVYTLLDKDKYTQTASLDFRAKTYLSRDQLLRLRYEVSFVDDLDKRFSFLDGWRHKARASSTWYLDNNLRLLLSYQLELNNREDLDTPRFISFSPTRHTLRLQGVAHFNPRYEAAADFRYRYSRYNDATVRVDGTDKTRKESRYRATLNFTRHLRRGWDISAEYRYTNNSSNFRRDDYHRHESSISLLIPW